VIAAGDTNHVQPAIALLGAGGVATLGANLAFTAPTWTLDSARGALFAGYWNKVTMCYNSTGKVSWTSMYINGTLLGRARGAGGLLRWADSTALNMGGYPTAATSFGGRERFYGWVDDLAFYSRVWSDAEVASKWAQAADTSDNSLFIYYNFDDPSTGTIANLGTVGMQANLVNGQVMGGTSYTEDASGQVRALTPATFVPGAPVLGAPTGTPLVYSADALTVMRVRVACFASSAAAAAATPTAATLTGFTGSGNGGTAAAAGALAQADSGQTAIPAFPTVLTSGVGAFWYTASATAGAVDIVTYTCMCNGATQSGTIHILTAPRMAPDPAINATVVSTTTPALFLHGSIPHPGLPSVNITSLPALGTLSQMDFFHPYTLRPITRPNTRLTNALAGFRYLPTSTGVSGTDTFTFVIVHGGVVSAPVTVTLTVSAWAYPPSIPAIPLTATVVNRQPLLIRLPVTDPTSKQFLGVNIFSLPSKGTLHQRNADGTVGAPITQVYQRSTALSAVPTVQYATGVANVSSFWGASKDYAPLQALGPKDCPNVAADCAKAWCPLTMRGTGGLASGGGQGLTFSHNPEATYSAYGYTEFIELTYSMKVYPANLLIGEPRGPGAIKTIYAKDPLGHFMPIWHAPSIDSTIETLYYKFNQYRTFVPQICLPPFTTNHLRFEMNTRDVPDWHEYDFFELQGSNMSADHRCGAEPFLRHFEAHFQAHFQARFPRPFHASPSPF